MREKRDCWVCSECGFAWVAKDEVPPSHCASNKCHSRKWNLGFLKIKKSNDPLVPEIHETDPTDPFEELPPKPVKVKRSTSCHECGALKNQHQKTCSKRKGAR